MSSNERERRKLEMCDMECNGTNMYTDINDFDRKIKLLYVCYVIAIWI